MNPPNPTEVIRIVLCGRPGSGKSTIAARLAARLDLDHIELDALFHQADWTPRDPGRPELSMSYSTRWPNCSTPTGS